MRNVKRVVLRASGGWVVLMWAATAYGDCPTDKAYTTASDFNTGGFGINVNTGAGDQLKVNADPVPLPFIWVANSERGTIVRINTDTKEVVGEYYSSPDDRFRYPSRTAVDLFGNIWAGNRAEGDNDIYGEPKGSVVKIGLVIGGTRNGEYLDPPFDYCTCVDRTGPGGVPDGRIRTSSRLGNIFPWPDTTDGQGGWPEEEGCNTTAGPALVEDAVDECILVFQRTNGPAIRHLSVDANNNVWAGTEIDHDFDLLDGEAGALLTSFTTSVGGYGGLVDGNAVLWSSSGGDNDEILRYDTKGTLTTDDDTWTVIGGNENSHNSYGLGIDSLGNIWSTQWFRNQVHKFDPSGTPFGSFPVATDGDSHDRGVVVTPLDNDVWIANSGDSGGTNISRIENDGVADPIVIELSTHGCETPTGVAVDADGMVWAICRDSDQAIRIDPATNDVASNGIVDLGSGAGPYNYSDLTGTVALLALKYGMWTAIHDSSQAGARWNKVVWNVTCTSQPKDTSIRVQIRAAETEVGLTRESFVELENSVAMIQAAVGRYVQVRVILNGMGYDTNFFTPLLCGLTRRGDSSSGRDCGRWINTHATGTYVSAPGGNFLSQESWRIYSNPRIMA